MTQTLEDAPGPTGTPAGTTSRMVHPGLMVPFVLLVTCFAAWGIVTAMCDPLVATFKTIFSMSALQSSLVQFAFYGAYFCLALPAAFINRRFSYKVGVLTGLGIFSVGGLLFYPAAESMAYLPFLIALFVLACGLSLLETSANPFIISMGPEATATRRLNLAQAFNPLGTNLGILISTVFILSALNPATPAERAAMPPVQLRAIQRAELEAVSEPYVIIAVLLIALWIAFFFARVPKAQEEAAGSEAFLPTMRRLFRNPNYRFGVIAQFFYIGAQTCVWTYTIPYVKESLDSDEVTGGVYLQASMIVFLVSRFVFTFLMRYVAPPKLLLASSVLALVLIAVLMASPNIVGAWSLVLVSFCMSLMFPTIYGVALHGLGADTKFGGAGLVMAIVGGALMPVVQGGLSDAIGVAPAFGVDLVCFVVVGAYAWYVVRHLRTDDAGATGGTGGTDEADQPLPAGH